jgi:hypothetical protein
MKKHLYLIDVGYLLDETDDEFESYAVCYDKKWGYYDYYQYLVDEEHLHQAIENTKKFLEENCYIVATYQGKWELEEEDIDKNGKVDLFDCSSIDYSLENIIYSARKENKNIIENFINRREEQR